MKVVIIGSGNVATVLGNKMYLAGHTIAQVVSRTETHAAELANVLNAPYSSNLLSINTEADIYVISVTDNCIKEIARELQLQSKLVVHTAGSISISVLENTGGHYGILYPLQSLKKQTTHMLELPILVDGNNAKVKNELREFACTWASPVIIANDEERMKLHVAAVITSNFSNHLYALAEAYCKKEGVEFNALIPLIKETATRLEEYLPADVQTGPAARGDVATIDKHLHMLSHHPALRKIYLKMTESIMENKNLLYSADN